MALPLFMLGLGEQLVRSGNGTEWNGIVCVCVCAYFHVCLCVCANIHTATRPSHPHPAYGVHNLAVPSAPAVTIQGCPGTQVEAKTPNPSLTACPLRTFKGTMRGFVLKSE